MRSGLPRRMWFCPDAVQTPMSLHEPVYNDGGDALYVMDQVSDKKNREEKLGGGTFAGGCDGTAQ